MTVVGLIGGGARARDAYLGPMRDALADALPGARAAWEAPPETVDWLVVTDWKALVPPDPIDLSAYSRLKGVHTVWAGVEEVVDAVPPHVPLMRMVDPKGLTAGMVEYVTAHVLRHHLGLDRWIAGPHPGWDDRAPPLAPERRVGVLGLGALGAACAGALAALGFDVAGWSRSAKTLPGVASHVGRDGLRAVIERSEILALLVPHTPRTERLMDEETLSWMPDGAILLNPGRGGLVDDDALLAALPRLGHATLDTFRQEPLSPDHPYWSHPKVTITPHIASTTRPVTAARVIAETLRRAEAGEPLRHVVDRVLGY